MSETQNICGRPDCEKPGNSRCSRCKNAHYCSKECQKVDWKTHKKNCKDPCGTSSKKKEERGQFSSNGININVQPFDKDKLLEALTNKGGWYQGLSYKKRHEWLVDCYRMRIDDDYVWGGCNLHGLYDPDIQGCSVREKKFHVLKDFLVFTKLAVKNKIIPDDKNLFSFDDYLKEAADLLGYAFEKSDAKEKWGGENVFSTSPSLRRTAESIYGSSCMQQFTETEEEERNQRTVEYIERKVENGVKFNIKSSNPTLFMDVGGLDLWVKLYSQMKMTSY